MKKLEYGKNYAYLFFIIMGIVLFLFLTGLSKVVALIVFSISFAYLSVLELYSGIALSRSWTANCRKKDHPVQFYTSVILGLISSAFMLVAAFLVA
jgi:hypothetical protein